MRETNATALDDYAEYVHVLASSIVDPTKELTTEEMRKLIERNEIVQTNGLRPYNTVNV